MAIKTTLQPKYSIQKIFVIGLCIVLGLWGVYDYIVKIPAQERAYSRGQVCVAVKHALEADPGTDAAREAITTASGQLDAQLRAMIATVGPIAPDAPPTPGEVMESVRAHGDEAWMKRLVLYQAAMSEARRRTPGAPASEAYATIYELVKRDVSETAEVSPPGRFDRATQWMFILCLPCAPWFAWSLYRDRKKVYTLEDDGTLRTPGGNVAAGDIQDIDMSRWMKRSTADVVTTDGRRIKLDDYVHKGMHLIVGALASDRYPDEWESDAKKRKREEPAADATS